MLDTDVVPVLVPLGGPVYQRIHQLAQQIAPIRQRVNRVLGDFATAAAYGDPIGLGVAVSQWPWLRSDMQQLATLSGQMADAITQYKASPEYQGDANTAHMLDNWFAFASEWARASAAAVPEALHDVVDSTTGAAVDLAQQITDALAKVLANSTKSAFAGLAPLLIGAAVLLGLAYFAVRKAEGTRTYRRYVA